MSDYVQDDVNRSVKIIWVNDVIDLQISEIPGWILYVDEYKTEVINNFKFISCAFSDEADVAHFAIIHESAEELNKLIIMASMTNLPKSSGEKFKVIRDLAKLMDIIQ